MSAPPTFALAALDGWDANRRAAVAVPSVRGAWSRYRIGGTAFVGADFAPDDEAAMLLGEGNVLMIEPYIGARCGRVPRRVLRGRAAPTPAKS